MTATAPAALAPWVELHHIPDSGHARTGWLLVNRRTNMCIGLSDPEAAACGVNDTSEFGLHAPAHGELVAELTDAGFVGEPRDGSPVTGGLRCASAVKRVLTTLEVRTRHADRPARLLHDHGGRWLFHRWAVMAQIALALLGVLAMTHAIVDTRHIALRVHPSQIPVVIAIGAASILVHEMAHALVTVHGGGRVDAAGVRLHLGTPAFFVESIDAQLLNRRQRLVQAAAGPWAEWLLTSVAALWLWTAGPSLIGPALLARFVLLNGANVVSNLVPFAQLDGSWLLADAVGMPDLARQAEGAVSQLALAVILRSGTSLRDRLLAVYSAVNSAVAAGLLATSMWLWYQLFGGVVAALIAFGPFGWFTLATAGMVLGRPVVMAAAPRMRSGGGRIVDLAAALRFRAEFSWRVAAIEQIAATDPALAGLDDHQLGVLAGLLTKRNQRRSAESANVLAAPVPSSWATRFTSFLAVLDLRTVETVGKATYS